MKGSDLKNIVRDGSKRGLKAKLLFAFALCFIFALSVVLFRNMTLCNPGLFGNYYSDIRSRLDIFASSSSVETYSIFIIPEIHICRILGETIGSWFLGVYLASFIVGTVIVVYLLLKRLSPSSSFGRVAFFSVACMFLGSIAIPMISDHLFSPYMGSVWHNETYIGLRFFSILVLLFFFRMNNSYLEKVTVKDFVLESVLFIIVNCVKPNFTIAFAPAMLIMMIVDIIKSKGKGVKNWFLFGIPVIFGALVFLYQYSLLFSGNSANSAEGNDSHIVFVFGDMLIKQDHLILVLVLAYFFPITILITHIKEIVKCKFYLVCYLAWFFAFLEYAFLAESGSRMSHGNFSWGLHLFTFIIFVISVGILLNDITKFKESDKTTGSKINGRFPDKIVFEIPLFLVHLFSGTVYFILVCLGACGYNI